MNYDTNNTEVQLIMVLKLQQLKRESIPSLTYDNLESFLAEELWKNGAPSSLHEAADDVWSIDNDQIVRFLSRKAVIDGSKSRLDDFSDLIGGN